MSGYSAFSDGEFDVLDLGTTVVAELGRSYGFKRGPDGALDWDLSNIKEAFSDSPIWTTIDWLLLATPPLKWAITAANIQRGIGLGGKMYKLAMQGSATALEDLSRVSAGIRQAEAEEKLLRSRRFRKLVKKYGDDTDEPDLAAAIEFGQALNAKLHKKGIGERLAERIGGAPFAQAMTIQRGSGLPGQRGLLGRMISRITSPLAHDISPEIVTLMKRYGADPADLRAFYVMAAAEQRATELMAATERNNLLRQLQKLAKSYGVDYGALQLKLKEADAKFFLLEDMRGKEMIPAENTLTEAESKFVNVMNEIFRLAEGGPREGSPILQDAMALKFLEAFESFRNKVHVEAYLTGHISGETFLRYLSRDANPQVYNYLEKAIQTGRGERVVEELVKRKGYRGLPVWYVPRQYTYYSRSTRIPAEAIGDWTEAVLSNHKRRAELLEEVGMKGANPKDDRVVYKALARKISLDLKPKTIYANPTAGARAQGINRFKRRKLGTGQVDPPYPIDKDLKLTTKLDPVQDMGSTITALTEAYALVSHNRLLQRLSDTAVIVDASDVLKHAKQLADEAPEALVRLYDADVDLIRTLREMPKEVANAADDASREVAQRLGWIPAERLFQGIKGMETLPAATREKFANRFVDPLVYRDIHGLMEALSVKIQGSFYARVLSFFRASKTAYSPPTWFRAYVGNVVFHHFTTGGVPTFVPLKGLKSWLAKDEVYQAALQTGHILDSSITMEIRDVLGDVAKRWGAKVDTPDLSALDWIGEGKIRNILKKGGAKAEELYRAIDEVWKLDAFLNVRTLARKAGLADQEATALATRQVVKFFPIFSHPSEVTNLLRQVIPFASFLTESARAWKNALIERPHLAFFWNHVTETLSYMMGAVAGISPEEIDATKEAMPHFLQGKKNLVLPFRVDGRPAVVDLSYIIPLADIAEAQAHEASFFQRLRIDPTTNPFISLIVAGATGVDPFSKRQIEPRFTERQLGVSVPENARRIVGLAEHMATSLAPPLAPMGYGLTNILELVRQQKHPATGEPLEEGIGRTLAANLIGIRIYEADVRSQILNVRHEERILSDEMTHWWNTWEWAVANGAEGRAVKAQQAIIRLRDKLAGDGEEYFEKSIIRHVPGNLRSVPTRQLQKILERTKKIGARSAQDRRLLRRIKIELRRRRLNR